MLIKANAKVLEESSKAIKAFEKIITETTAKVEKLQQEVTTFMVEFRTTSESNNEAINKVIEGFHNSLKAERMALSVIRSNIKVKNDELTSSVVSKIEKLQADLAVENKIMDELAEKTQKVTVHSVKMKNATKHIDYLEIEKTIIKSFVSKINQYLLWLVETHDSWFTI